jgi:hypothetical protein
VEVCSRLGADRILVFAITEFEPYTPTVGIAAQMYGLHRTSVNIDPVATSRMARPFPVMREERHRPWSQVQRTFNGEHEAVQYELRDYAESRGEDESPYGWRRFLASQRLYLRFCCFAVARELMQQEAKGCGGVRIAAS